MMNGKCVWIAGCALALACATGPGPVWGAAEWRNAPTSKETSASSQESRRDTEKEQIIRREVSPEPGLSDSQSERDHERITEKEQIIRRDGSREPGLSASKAERDHEKITEKEQIVREDVSREPGLSASKAERDHERITEKEQIVREDVSREPGLSASQSERDHERITEKEQIVRKEVSREPGQSVSQSERDHERITEKEQIVREDVSREPGLSAGQSERDHERITEKEQIVREDVSREPGLSAGKADSITSPNVTVPPREPSKTEWKETQRPDAPPGTPRDDPRDPSGAPSPQQPSISTMLPSTELPLEGEEPDAQSAPAQAPAKPGKKDAPVPRATADPQKLSASAKKKAEQQEGDKQAKPEPPPKPAKQPEAKPEKQPAKQPKQEQKPEPKQAKQEPKPGEPLRIPPEAAKTGDLSFLEGCWQGTRPEYYSKRIVRECFCFNKGGRTGKRHIFDDTQRRKCTGATRANLNKKGVLSVTSENSSCNDGEKWGQAEMVCRGEGQNTPCSWVFPDAEGGRQSYKIPFVRVKRQVCEVR